MRWNVTRAHCSGERHHDTGHGSDQGQEERVVRAHGADRQAGRPQPPGHRVQGTTPGSGGPDHSSAGLRRQRKKASPPRAATTTAIRTTGRTLLEGAAAGTAGCGAGRDGRRRASDAPWLPVHRCRVEPRTERGCRGPRAGVVVVADTVTSIECSPRWWWSWWCRPVLLSAVVGVVDGAGARAWSSSWARRRR